MALLSELQRFILFKMVSSKDITVSPSVLTLKCCHPHKCSSAQNIFHWGLNDWASALCVRWWKLLIFQVGPVTIPLSLHCLLVSQRFGSFVGHQERGLPGCPVGTSRGWQSRNLALKGENSRCQIKIFSSCSAPALPSAWSRQIRAR